MSDVDGRIAAALTSNHFIIEMTSHVTIKFRFEKSSVTTHFTLSYIGKLGDVVFLKAVLFVVVHVLERAETVLAHVKRVVVGIVGTGRGQCVGLAAGQLV